MIIFDRSNPAIARALARAVAFIATPEAQGAIDFREPDLPVYHIPSTSFTGLRYAVGISEIRGRHWIHCTCKAGRNNVVCTHAVLAYALHETIKAARTEATPPGPAEILDNEKRAIDATARLLDHRPPPFEYLEFSGMMVQKRTLWPTK